VTGSAPTIADIAAAWLAYRRPGGAEDLLYTVEAEHATS
jgi:glutathione S-transferase